MPESPMSRAGNADRQQPTGTCPAYRRTVALEGTGRIRQHMRPGGKCPGSLHAPAPDAPASGSPLSRAEDAKRRRDLHGEVGILADANANLESQPWYPLHVGNVVLVATSDGGIGETYLAEPDEFDPEGPEMALRRVSAATSDGMPEDWSLMFYDLWFEAGRDLLTVIRAGRVVFGQPLYVAEAGVHACSNCSGIDPDTCMYNGEKE